MAADGADDVIPVQGIPKSWGDVFVRAVSSGESDRWAAQAKERLGDLGEIEPTAFAAAIAICDAAGVREFDPLSREDLDLLSKRRKSDLMKVLNAAGAVSGN
jgi:hypothetical protein